jgi:hypothetical protein
MRTRILAVATAATAVAFSLTASAQPKPAAAQVPAPRAAAAAEHGPGTTVRGPHLWDPATGKPFPKASTVTVNQASFLVNQSVSLSWTGFTPSSEPLYNAAITLYPVMIAECRGINPASPDDCYGAANGGVPTIGGPDGPDNTVYATTAPDGTGHAQFQVETYLQNRFLGCAHRRPCSLVVVPAQGGDVLKSPPVCTDHSLDRFTAIGELAFGATYNACSWADRIVVPLRFARSAGSCPLRHAAFAGAGSPMLARAMDSWVTGLCAGPHGTAIEYNSATPEPTAIEEVLGKVADVALVTRPASADGIPTGRHHFVYAPVAVSAASIAYWIDNPVSGQPVTGVKLDQRLAAKLVTVSYNFQHEGRGCEPRPPFGCDKGVSGGNPETLFADPEFQRLNPGVRPVAGAGATFQIPTVASSHSDLTWTVSRWIDASRAARAFLRGKPDPWGMRVNSYYRGLGRPVNIFTVNDPYPVIVHQYVPVFPFSQVAFYQASNWDPGTYWFKDPSGNYQRNPIEPPGQRALIAITGQGDAAAFGFPVAAIRNGAGRYAEPTAAAMAAAVEAMTPDGSGTLQVNPHSTDPAVYPLTMVIYAMAPTSGLPHARAAAIARFVDYAAGRGQVPGIRPGQLPAGYLPLTPALRAQARQAAQEILHQTGNH